MKAPVPSPSSTTPIATSPRQPRWRVEGARASAGFAVRTTVAAQLALLSATALGLHHVHWAAMSVWLVAQPTRGLLLEKSLLRVAGTLVGAAVGFGLLALFPDRLVPLVAGLALWGALCAGASAFVRPARAYGILLAGYTAIMLALPSSAGIETVHGLFADRVLCTLVGVLMSTAITALFTPAQSPASLDAPLRRLADDVFSFAHAVRAGMSRPLLDRQRHLVATIGRLGEETDRALLGFLTNRRRRRKVRRALRVLLGLLVESRVAAERQPPEAASPLPSGTSAPEHIPLTAQGDALVARIRAGALRWRPRAASPERAASPPVSGVVARHAPGARSLGNHREAAIASAKAAAGMATVGAIWWATGWREGPTMMVSASVFFTLFAANESARTWVTHILVGSICGGAAAVAYVLLLPLARSPAGTALLAFPFLLVGAWAMARPLTAKSAIDFNMVFLLATPTAFALHGDVAATARRATAIVAGVSVAALFFHAAHEEAPRRVRRLAREMLRDVQRIAGSLDPEDARRRRGALADRVVRTAAAADLDGRLAGPADRAIDLLALGSVLARLVGVRDVAARAAGAPGPVATALDRVRDDLRGHAECAAVLDRAAESLDRAPSRLDDRARRTAAAESLRDAARIIRRVELGHGSRSN
ncbi:MAG TPA: FUSC family protein [Anaeromyxobacteraceae bacterium]|nr:FUSC family protein [Anaeromyxobacteraceae bacterium]